MAESGQGAGEDRVIQPQEPISQPEAPKLKEGERPLGPEEEISPKGISEETGEKAMKVIGGEEKITAFEEKFPTGRLDSQISQVLQPGLTEKRAEKFMKRTFTEYSEEIGQLKERDLADLLRIAIISRNGGHISGVLQEKKFKIGSKELVQKITDFTLKGDPYIAKFRELLLPPSETNKNAVFEGDDFFKTIRDLKKITKPETKFWRRAKDNSEPALFSAVTASFIENSSLGERFLLFMTGEHWKVLNKYYKEKGDINKFPVFFRNLGKEANFERDFIDPKNFETAVERMAAMT